MLIEEDIETRRPVWVALSELWLDTELDAGDLERIAAIMVQSGYTLEQLHHIYSEEVAPVVYTNLLTPAGEWIGFDDKWLRDSIIKYTEHDSLTRRLARRLAAPLMLYATKRHWLSLHSIIMTGSVFA